MTHFSGFPSRASQALNPMKTNSYSTSTSYVYEMDVPGFSNDDIKVTLNKNNHTFTVSGERKDVVNNDKDGYHLQEVSYGSTQRTYTLPKDVSFESGQQTLQLDSGVLKVVFQKLLIEGGHVDDNLVTLSVE